MQYRDTYNLELDIEGKELDQYPSNYSFTIYDSIFNLYPQARLVFNDQSGQFNEFMGFINGTQITLTYGNKDNALICPFVVVGNSNPESMAPSLITGNIETELLHEYSYKQALSSQYFNDEISNIVNKKISAYTKWGNNNIQKTQTKGAFYQPLIQDDEFMLENLLPYAYSSNNSSSPFYMFIDNNSNFNFVNHANLLQKSPVAKYVFVPRGTVFELRNDSIISFHNIQQSVKKLYPTFHKFLFNFNSDSSIAYLDDKINSYFAGKANPIAVKRDLTGFTSKSDLLDNDIVLEETTNHNLGLRLYDMRQSFHVDQAVLVTSFNPNIRAGVTVGVEIPIATDQSSKEMSQRFSSGTENYLVESCYQKWTGRQGVTISIISKKSTGVDKSYRVVNQVIQPS